MTGWYRQSWLRTAVRFVQGVGVGLRDHAGFVSASAMAFNFFLSFIPMLVLVGWLLGLAHSQSALMDPTLGTLPPSIADMARAELLRMADVRGAKVAPLTIAGFLWIASSGTSSLMTTFEVALRVQRRSWWTQRVIAIGWMTGMIVASCVTFLGVVWLDRVMRGSMGARFLAIALVWSVLTAGLALLYRVAVRHPPGIRRRVWPGAIVAVSGVMALTWGFGNYVRSLASYALFYGSAAAVATLLVWLYLVSLALLVGAEVNARLEGVRPPLPSSSALPEVEGDPD